MSTEIDLRYPVGKFVKPASIDRSAREAYIGDLEAAPGHVRSAVARLTDAQLDTPYREGGWTVRQVVHHLPDSHLNAYTRFKLALTEAEPTIKPYEESLWAELPEAKRGPIDMSLRLLESIHVRWVACLRALPDPSFVRAFRHPESGRWTIDEQLAMYAWHGRHHVAHITSLRERMGWR
jgi:uncharacterized damage-inducible protein DinB